MTTFTEHDCVHDDGKVKVNYDLAVKKNLDSSTVERIRQLQMTRRKLNDIIRTVPVHWARIWDKHYRTLTSLEFALQRLWGFDEDVLYHPHRDEMHHYVRRYRDFYWA